MDLNKTILIIIRLYERLRKQIIGVVYVF